MSDEFTFKVIKYVIKLQHKSIKSNLPFVIPQRLLSSVAASSTKYDKSTNSKSINYKVTTEKNSFYEC